MGRGREKERKIDENNVLSDQRKLRWKSTTFFFPRRSTNLENNEKVEVFRRIAGSVY